MQKRPPPQAAPQHLQENSRLDGPPKAAPTAGFAQLGRRPRNYMPSRSEKKFFLIANDQNGNCNENIP